MTKILIEIDTDTQRVVPVEPTVKILCAGRDTPCETTGDDAVDAPEDYRRVYRAMLAAAPQPGPVDADLRRDAERLDYLQKNGSTVCLFGKNLLFMVGGLTSTRSSSIRKSIDSAMSQGEQK